MQRETADGGEIEEEDDDDEDEDEDEEEEEGDANGFGLWLTSERLGISSVFSENN